MDTNSNSSIEYVYIDESGKTEIRISRENTPDYYVICGIFILNNRMPEFKQKADAIVHRHAAEGELTSDNIGLRIDRRKQILADIAQQNFPFYCLVINKQRIWQVSSSTVVKL